ncbi:hypothetical protein [Vibrio methylphosphonaticus]|uniref:hypothetical protein n=1 Tax=Vibrio methylphosphonaticus TaxID=2946866 RepID=UPI00202A87DA|nr:hypothetical protein [Vibrio methylphosphonaticus]MCL9776598.1 hypothetical protein [Vibrio methylphosphonaticus]
MNVDKAKKRIAKQVKKGFKGYPQITLEYRGESAERASEVVIQFVQAEGAQIQEELFSSTTDARNDEVIQSVIVKIIERANASSVIEVEGVSVI